MPELINDFFPDESGLMLPFNYQNTPLQDMTYANTAAASTTGPVTFETISKAIQKFEMVSPVERLPPERIVMTDQCYLALQEDCEKKAGYFGMNGAEFGALTHIYGIQIEHYPTEAACICRAAELFSQHKLRVALVTHQE